MLKSINPYNQLELQVYTEMPLREIESIINQSHETFHQWKKSSFSYRAELFRQLSRQLLKDQQELATLAALEMGKPITQGLAEIEKCAATCLYYAEHGEQFLREEMIPLQPSHDGADAVKSFVTYRPLGVILGIMPWNFPFWQALRFLIPTLMAGNTCLLKHASNVTGCALRIEQLLLAAGFPAGVFRTLIIQGSSLDPVLAHPLIRGISLTGSVPAGRHVAKRAGEQLKKVVLELGGSDPYLILEDADVPYAAKICAAARLTNSGQTCIAAKRFVVAEKIHDEFLHHLQKEFATYQVGDPLNSSTQLGPLSLPSLREELQAQVDHSLALGARLIYQHSLSSLSKDCAVSFFAPQILTGVQPGMKIFDEETFGPVAAVIKASSEEEMIWLANQTSFGLGSAVFTQDLERGERICREELDSGNSFVNAQVKSDPRLPFGGIKDSGVGRELSSFGMKEFVNIKSVWVQR